MFLRKRSILAGIALSTALCSLSQAATATAGYEENFREGVRAGDLKKWQEAAAHMAEAIAENPTESKKRIALSGVFSSPYIPHFYRGWFLYQQGQSIVRSPCESSRSRGIRVWC